MSNRRCYYRAIKRFNYFIETLYKIKMDFHLLLFPSKTITIEMDIVLIFHKNK
jgi:hypothetical protein